MDTAPTTQLIDKRRSFEGEALPHLDSLYRYSLRLTGEPARAEDLVQETMVKAYRSWGRYESGTNIRAWLFTILRNTLISQYRRLRNQFESVDIADLEDHTIFDGVQDADPKGRFFDEIVDDRVMSAVDSLQEDYREVLVLSDIEELTYEEIAQVVGVPIGTVKSRLHRARRILQRQLYLYALEMGYIGEEYACCA